MDTTRHPMVYSRKSKTRPEIAARHEHCDGRLQAALPRLDADGEAEAEPTVPHRYAHRSRTTTAKTDGVMTGYFLLGDSLNTTVTVTGTLQNSVVAYDSLTLTYFLLVGHRRPSNRHLRLLVHAAHLPTQRQDHVQRRHDRHHLTVSPVQPHLPSPPPLIPSFPIPPIPSEAQQSQND